MNSPAKVDAFRKEIQALAALAMADFLPLAWASPIAMLTMACSWLKEAGTRDPPFLRARASTAAFAPKPPFPHGV